MPGLHVGGEDGGVVWLNAGVACSWRGGGVGCGMWWCGVQQLHRPGLSSEPRTVMHPLVKPLEVTTKLPRPFT